MKKRPPPRAKLRRALGAAGAATLLPASALAADPQAVPPSPPASVDPTAPREENPYGEPPPVAPAPERPIRPEDVPPRRWVDAPPGKWGVWLNPGFRMSFAGAGKDQVGLGAEVSTMWYPWGSADRDAMMRWGLGVFGQLERFGSSDSLPANTRYAFGPQLGVLGFLGLEAGYAHREGVGGHGSTHGLHLAPFFSLGVVGVSFVFTVPLSASGGPSYGIEAGGAVTVKLPLPLGSPAEPPSFGFGRGRPARAKGGPILAEACGVAAWRGRRRPRTDGLDPRTREVLAARWLEDALLEHSSVAAFAQLALDLMALGAPPGLVARCHRAAIEEVAHARDCFALASAYAGSPVGPAPMAGLAEVSQAEGAADVLRATFVDGCLGEAIGVATARAAHARATDPSVRAILARIARDEARHAELAWAVVAFCCTRIPGAHERLREALAHAPRLVPPPAAGGRAAHLHAHGRLGRAELLAIERRVRREVQGRLARLARDSMS